MIGRVRSYVREGQGGGGEKKQRRGGRQVDAEARNDFRHSRSARSRCEQMGKAGWDDLSDDVNGRRGTGRCTEECGVLH